MCSTFLNTYSPTLYNNMKTVFHYQYRNVIIGQFLQLLQCSWKTMTAVKTSSDESRPFFSSNSFMLYNMNASFYQISWSHWFWPHWKKKEILQVLIMEYRGFHEIGRTSNLVRFLYGAFHDQKIMKIQNPSESCFKSCWLKSSLSKSKDDLHNTDLNCNTVTQKEIHVLGDSCRCVHVIIISQNKPENI